MTRFRPCIDLHSGQVKQIVGSTLTDSGQGLKTNFVSDRDAAWYAKLYQQDQLSGGHVIMLGQGNDPAAKSALSAYPGGLQIGVGFVPAMPPSISKREPATSSSPAIFSKRMAAFPKHGWTKWSQPPVESDS